MDRILDESFATPAGETVLVQSRTLTTKDPAFEAAVEDVVRRVSAVPVVTNVRSPLEPANADQVSADRRSAIVTFDIRGDPDDAVDKIDPVVAAVEEAKSRPPAALHRRASARRRPTRRSARRSARTSSARACSRFRSRSSILIVAFGALVAAGIPLLLALSAVMATMGLLALPSQVWPVDENVSAVVLLIGLAVGVDYSLFYLKREREERAAGRSERPRSRPPPPPPAGPCSSPARR